MSPSRAGRRSLRAAVGAIAAAALLGGFTLHGASASAARPARPTASSTILIGMVSGTSGAYSSGAIALLDGALLAVDDLNHRGGALGRRFTLQSYDDEAQPALAAKLFERLAGAGAVAILGSADAGPATAAAADQLKVPDLGVLDDSAATIYPDGASRPPLPWVWNSGPDSAAVGALDAAYALRSCRRLAVLHDTTSYGDGGEAAIASAYAAAHRTLALDDAVRENWSTGAPASPAGEVAKVKASRADCVLAWLTPGDTAALAQALRSSHVGVTLLGNDAMAAGTTFPLLAGPAAAGAIAPEFTTQVHPSAALASFDKSYQAKFHLAANAYAIAEYDAVMMLGQVIAKQRSTSSAALQAGLDAISNSRQLQGSVSFSRQDHAPVSAQQLTLARFDAASKTWQRLGS